MGGADPSAGQHGDRSLRHHREIDGHPVTGFHSGLDQRVGRALDLLVQLRIRDVLGVARLPDEVHRHPVSVPCLHMSVYAVHAGVEFAASEPGGNRRLGPVECLLEVGVPREQVTCLICPEADRILLGRVIELLRAVGLGHEVFTGGEESFFVGQIGQRFLGHSAS